MLKFDVISLEPEKKWKKKVVQDFWRSVYIDSKTWPKYRAGLHVTSKTHLAAFKENASI